MSMYNTVERDGKTIVIDHFTGQAVSDEEQLFLVIFLHAEASTPPVEETENPKTQDEQT